MNVMDKMFFFFSRILWLCWVKGLIIAEKHFSFLYYYKRQFTRSYFWESWLIKRLILNDQSIWFGIIFLETSHVLPFLFIFIRFLNFNKWVSSFTNSFNRSAFRASFKIYNGCNIIKLLFWNIEFWTLFTRSKN